MRCQRVSFQKKNSYLIKVCSFFVKFPAYSIAWSVITFFGESVKGVFDRETNETYFVEVPRLPIKSYYPWDAMSGFAYFGSFVFQVKEEATAIKTFIITFEI